MSTESIKQRRHVLWGETTHRYSDKRCAEWHGKNYQMARSCLRVGCRENRSSIKSHSIVESCQGQYFFFFVGCQLLVHNGQPKQQSQHPQELEHKKQHQGWRAESKLQCFLPNNMPPIREFFSDGVADPDGLSTPRFSVLSLTFPPQQSAVRDPISGERPRQAAG